MSNYTAPVDDMMFLLNDVFAFEKLMKELPGHEDTGADLAASILEEAGKFCSDVIAPLNQSGDQEGCKLENGTVTTPKGFPEAYKQFCEAGWNGLSADPEFGGQGLPRVLQILFDEMVCSANLSFGLFPGLTRGAIEALMHHASDDLKSTYVHKMVSGEWPGVMALTEPHAGTDLGLLSTRAVPQDDGSYKITGNKIFISSGDQDFGGNIVHLVLARLSGAPAGVKGISLFVVPKFVPKADGTSGPRNGVWVGALEHKMGIHAQPTCQMVYEDAVGWMVGEPNRGLNAMFTMMNAERLFVGIQGLGIGEAAYQKAQEYAKDRLQSRSPDGTRGPVAIIEHPDVRKMLLQSRALTEGGRALAVWTALQMDKAERHPDAAIRKQADQLVALVTPVIKAALSDFGFETAVACQQVFGGHGYVREWGMEQYVRDARIAMIYEGTNGVQAMDLVTRKLTMEGGELPRRFIALVKAELHAMGAAAGIGELLGPVKESVDRLERVTEALQKHATNGAELGAAATDYLRMFALTAFGWLWARMAAHALEAGADPTPLHRRKIALAQFFVARVLPQTLGLERSIMAGAAPLMELEADLF